jgi:ATP-binding cassette subfamily C protein/ATP-binding cassette subfamily C protein EexD
MSVFINLTLLAVPLYSLQVYDRVLSSRNLGTLAMLTLIVGAFLALYGILEYVRSAILLRCGVRFSDVVSRPLFEVALRAQLAGRPATASQAMRDGDALREALSGSTISTLFDVPWTPAFVAICFLFHPAMGAVALTGAILIFACALLTELATKDGVAAANRHAGDVARFSAAGLRNAEIVRGLGMAQAVCGRWQDMQGAMLGEQTRASERGALTLAFSKSLRMSVQVALIGTGAWLAIDRLISPGVMLAAMIIMARALAPVEQAVANWKRLVGARAAWTRLADLFQSLPEPAAATLLPEPRGDLKVENLVLKPRLDAAAVIKDVSFAIEAGTALAIIGPSGSGKSSLMRALAGIWRPAYGVVRLDGAALEHWHPAQLGRHVGYMPQSVEFFAGTVAENIARLGAVDDGAVVEAAKAAGVHEAVLRLPQGYQTVLGEGGAVLSGGMCQRLALARALFGDPCLVLLDEPNSNLDTEGEAALVETLVRMKQARRTVVVVTHRPQLLAHVERVLILADGRVQAFADRNDVLRKVAGSKVAPLSRRPTAAEARTAPGIHRSPPSMPVAASQVPDETTAA